MKQNTFFVIALFFGIVFFSYTETNAQIVDKTKEAASKAKDVTVKTAKKTKVVVSDALDDAADKTKSVADDVADTTVSKTKTFGSHTVRVTENIAGAAYEGGRYLTVTTWNGVRWVSRKVWFPNKTQ